MRFLVLSDTHGGTSYFISEIKKHENIDKIIHLGDYVRDAFEIQKNTKIPVIMVRGNNDYNDVDIPYDLIINVKNHKILITHGHNYKVYFGIQNLYYRALETGCDIVLYGHTHCYLDENVDGIRILNPGSITMPRDKIASYILLDIDYEIKVEKFIK